jgi:hypothetical protein
VVYCESRGAYVRGALERAGVAGMGRRILCPIIPYSCTIDTMRSLLRILAALALATPSLVAQTSAVQAGAQAAGDAMMAGDYETFVGHTYPALVEQLGGRDSMVSRVKTGIEDVARQGFTFVSVKAHAPTRFDTVGTRIFAQVPTTTRITAPGGHLVVEATMLCISEDTGATWTYIDVGEGIDAGLALLFPDVPDLKQRLQLPARSTPRFEPNE